jgi:hypothetical protein
MEVFTILEFRAKSLLKRPIPKKKFPNLAQMMLHNCVHGCWMPSAHHIGLLTMKLAILENGVMEEICKLESDCEKEGHLLLRE